MRFSESWITHEDNVFCSAHIATLGQFQDTGLGDALDKTEIKTCQFFHNGKLRVENGTFNLVCLPLFCFCLAERQEIPLEGKVRACCVLGKGLVVLRKSR